MWACVAPGCGVEAWGLRGRRAVTWCLVRRCDALGVRVGQGWLPHAPREPWKPWVSARSWAFTSRETRLGSSRGASGCCSCIRTVFFRSSIEDLGAVTVGHGALHRSTHRAGHRERFMNEPRSRFSSVGTKPMPSSPTGGSAEGSALALLHRSGAGRDGSAKPILGIHSRSATTHTHTDA